MQSSSLSFLVLGYYGSEIYRQAPPMPERVVTTDGTVLFTGQDINDGQNVWQSMGGQEVGTIWGHGAYVAPDWSADWLHREATWLLNHWAAESGGKTYARPCAREHRPRSRQRLKEEIRTNTYDAANGRPGRLAGARRGDRGRGRALRRLCLATTPELQHLRKAYAIPANTIKDPGAPAHDERVLLLDRVGLRHRAARASTITYTNNWPAEALIGNRPTGSDRGLVGVSFVVLLAGIGALGLVFRRGSAIRTLRNKSTVPQTDPLLALKPDALDAGDAEVFLGGGGADRGAGRARRRHRALRRGGRRLLRHPARPMAALLGDPHLAHAVGHLLDRHRLAGDGAVHRARRFRAMNRAGKSWA